MIYYSISVLFTFSLMEMLKEYERIVASIPTILLPLMTPYRNRVEEALSPGLTSLNWTSLGLDQCKCDSRCQDFNRL